MKEEKRSFKKTGYAVSYSLNQKLADDLLLNNVKKKFFTRYMVPSRYGFFAIDDKERYAYFLDIFRCYWSKEQDFSLKEKEEWQDFFVEAVCDMALSIASSLFLKNKHNSQIREGLVKMLPVALYEEVKRKLSDSLQGGDAGRKDSEIFRKAKRWFDGSYQQQGEGDNYHNIRYFPDIYNYRQLENCKKCPSLIRYPYNTHSLCLHL